MADLLGASPGWLTPFGTVNDADVQVTIVLDASLLDTEQVNFHPLVQEESVGLSPTHLLAFIRSCGREPIVIDLEPAAQDS